MGFQYRQHLPDCLASRAPVIDLTIYFPEYDGAAENEDLEQHADFFISKNGTRVFTGRTTVDALFSPLELVSEALSFLNHPDPEVMAYLIRELSYCAIEAAELADCTGWGIRLFADICLRPMKMAKYRDGGQFGEAACAICLEDFEEETLVARMPCSHIFHGLCISRWFRRSHLCPLCRSACYEL